MKSQYLLIPFFLLSGALLLTTPFLLSQNNLSRESTTTLPTYTLQSQQVLPTTEMSVINQKPTVSPSTNGTPLISKITNSSTPISSASYRTIINLVGNGFGTTFGTVIFKSHNGLTREGEIVSWKDQELAIIIPAFESNTSVTIQVKTSDNKVSNEIPFTITDGQPRITSVQPENGKPGSELTIRGTGFGGTKGNVYFFGEGLTTETGNCTIQYWSDETVVCAIASIPSSVNYTLQLVTNNRQPSEKKSYFVGN